MSNTFKLLVGKSKVSDCLPLLERIASENGLKLNRAKDFKQARNLLESRYTVRIVN